MLRVFGIAVLSAALALVAPHTAAAQAQAANGNIEGTVRDSSGASLPGVTVTVTNMETGDDAVVGHQRRAAAIARRCCRSAATECRAELQGFKTFEQQGITLSAGQTALINVELECRQRRRDGHRTSESPIAQPGKIDLGRTIGEAGDPATCRSSRATRTTSRSSRPTSPATRTTSSACRASTRTARRCTPTTSSTATPTPRRTAPGLRMLPVSEVLVREVKVITNGFAPEFGQTTGMVYNAITPSGTNDLHGSTSFRFRRNPMSAAAVLPAPTARKPDTEVNDFNGDARRADRAETSRTSTARYEYVDRSLVTGDQVITVDPANARRRLGITLPAERRHPGAPEGQLPLRQDRLPDQRGQARSSARYFLFKNFSPSNIAGGLTTTGPGDRLHRPHGLGVRAAGVDASARRQLNELRVQYARRHQFRTLADTAVDGSGDHGQRRRQLRRAAHRRRQLGRLRLQPGDLAGHRQLHLAARQSTASRRASTRSSSPTIASTASASSTPSRRTAAYLAAKSGASPLGYTNLQQDFGDLDVSTTTRAFYGFFVQDDWQISAAHEAAVRAALRPLRRARRRGRSPPTRISSDFTIDKNNFAPRAGFSWSLDDQARRPCCARRPA